MTIEPGTKLGTYEITGTLGAGGMGEVYRARDVELERDVAIKVLPPSFLSDADRVARFEQEAKTLALLNHPNIAHVYGIVRGEGVTGLVMELIDGPTLADRITEGALPADEALGIAMQIANALEAAHVRGIVHRDLKPANIKLRPDGTVKVLDFGIAKALSPELSGTAAQSPIMTTPVTQIGVILGTAAYMSPEQARGKNVDQRTDIWAFGCLLYEMLTGQLAFAGEDVAVIMARVIANDTDMSSLPKLVSPAVRHTIALCLQKDPAKRIADIRDVRLALAGAFEANLPISGAVQAAPLSVWRRALPVAAALVLAVAAGLAAWALKPGAPKPVSRFTFELPEGFTFRNTGRSAIAVSPDGQYIVYNTVQGLYLRSRDAFDARVIQGTEESLWGPFFSPDSQSIAYVSTSGLERIAVSGGASVRITGELAANGGSGFGGSWSDDNTILLATNATNAGIYRVSANGGAPELVIPATDGETIAWPSLLPDGDSVLFTSRTDDSWDRADVVVESLTTGERRVLVAGGGADGRYVSTGHLVYALGDGLFGVAFDAGSLEVKGGPVPLIQDLARGPPTGAGQYGIARDGTLVYVSGGQANVAPLQLFSVDRAGRTAPLGMAPCTCIEVSASPDGTRVAVAAVENAAAGAPDIWVWSRAQRTLQRLTFEPGAQLGIVWSPDSRRIAYWSEREGIWSRAADGTGVPQQLLDDPNAVPYHLAANDELLFTTTTSGDFLNGRDIGIVPADGDRTPRMLLATSASETRPAVSPDGRWLAYQSDETGVFEIFVRPFPDVDSGKWQLSTGGGEEPEWSADGATLYFRSPDALMASAIDAGPSFSWRPAERVLDLSGRTYAGQMPRQYAVSPDGEGFLLISLSADSGVGGNGKIRIVENWTEELKRLVPTE